jgi:hypothetical protein
MLNLTHNNVTIPVLIVDNNILFNLFELIIATNIVIPSNMPRDNIVTIKEENYISMDGLVQLFSILGTAESAFLLFLCYSYIASLANQTAKNN